MKRTGQTRDRGIAEVAIAANAPSRAGAFGALLATRMRRARIQPKMPASAIQQQIDSAAGVLSRVLAMLRASCVHRSSRRLSITETIPLGEKRFVALLRIDEQEFLIGVGGAGVSLLAALESAPEDGGHSQ